MVRCYNLVIALHRPHCGIAQNSLVCYDSSGLILMDGVFISSLINNDIFDTMKDDVVFVNISRAAVMDEDYVWNALESDRLSVFGADVYGGMFQNVLKVRVIPLQNMSSKKRKCNIVSS